MPIVPVYTPTVPLTTAFPAMLIVAQGTVLCVVLLFHDPAYDHPADSGQPFDRAIPMNDYMFILFRCQTKTAPLFLNITQGTVLCVSLD